MENLNEILKIRREKLLKLQEMGRDPYKADKYDRTAFAKDIVDKFDDFEGKTVAIAGRIMANRHMGKTSFIDIQDSTGRIQSYVRRDAIGDEEYDVFKTYDIGDIVGVRGEVFRTQKNEISVKAEEVQLLTKSLQILPEKYHGLRDVETRYRQRYVDMIVNPDVRTNLIKRFAIMAAMKKYFVSEGFLEVETPVLSVIAGGANAKPFVTHHNAYDIDMYMRIANELYLKRLIVGGFDKVFEMGKMFRNEGVSYKHHPEYTSVELYAAYRNYEYMIEITEQSVSRACLEVNGSMIAEYEGMTLDFTPPWKRVSMHKMVEEKTGVDFYGFATDEEARAIAKDKLNLDVKPHMTRGHLVSLAFEEFCEGDLEQPTFVLHHPVEISPLAKRNPEHPEYTNRFEAFAAKMEIANGFSELNDPIDQRSRFEAQERERALGDEEAHVMDYDFLNAIEVGLPPTGGLGIGVDRVVMILTGKPSIREIIPFPTMKPLDISKDKNIVQKSSDAATIKNTFEEAPASNVSDPSMPIFDAKKPDFESLVIEPLFEDLVDFETFSKSDFRAVKVKDCVAVPNSKKLLQFTLDDGTDTDRTILSGIHAYYEPEQLIGKTCIAITNLPLRKMMGIESCGMLISAVHKEGEEEKLHLLMVDPSIPAGAKLY